MIGNKKRQISWEKPFIPCYSSTSMASCDLFYPEKLGKRTERWNLPHAVSWLIDQADCVWMQHCCDQIWDEPFISSWTTSKSYTPYSITLKGAGFNNYMLLMPQLLGSASPLSNNFSTSLAWLPNPMVRLSALRLVQQSFLLISFTCTSPALLILLQSKDPNAQSTSSITCLLSWMPFSSMPSGSC